MNRRGAVLGMAGLSGVAGAGLWWLYPRPPAQLTDDAFRASYAHPLPAPATGLPVYHLGHSLVGHDMPAFIAQLAESAGFAGHGFHSQLGWGSSLRDHWDPAHPVNGFAEMNATQQTWRDPHEALESGAYDAFIMTEMVELNDAIRWHDSPRHTALWAATARRNAPGIRIYMYESWPHLTTLDDWLHRLDNDPETLWEGTILAGAMAQPDTGVIHVIPAGRVMAALTRAVAAQGGLAGMPDHTALFARTPTGELDPIHLSDMGKYLVALTHFAVLYHQDPRGLPHALLRADGSPAQAPSNELADLMQAIVWSVVQSVPETGLAIANPHMQRATQ
ncbi:hypothetical protein [Roseinatronobacter alkalisoli]|uniref:Uncharacterized protein n=1 Tax=Roseinatronobacter alkalisoli TaxID=3028235 RepID=A0ABT5T928_9RHOB|nr:hypothetical protein [Roseinatronobacter sp. HJB301]MDD7971574.1 hypothetical protein [Roseinatronobacter sp. HJB301]